MTPRPVPGPSPAAAAIAGAVAPTGKSELEIQAASRRVLNLILSTPCRAHEAARGAPCWTVPSDIEPHPAVCGLRVAAVREALARRRPAPAELRRKDRA